MHDIATLATAVAETRSRLIEEAARENDRRLGLAKLRAGIDALQAGVRPALEDARATLEVAGAKMEIEEGWASDLRAKGAYLGIVCSPAGGWPDHASYARGLRVIISHGPDGFSVASKPAHDRDVVGTPVPCEEGQEAGAAIELAVQSFLSAAGAGPAMRGAELRAAARSG